MFKVGDKVECTRMQVAGEYVVNPGYIGYISRMDAVSLAVDGKLCVGYPVMSHKAFKLAEREPQFDLKKNPWFISTGTKEKSEAAQKWLFEQGMHWWHGMEIRDHGEKYLTNADSSGITSSYILHGRLGVHALAQEIILEFETVVKSFETVVKSVAYPVVETEQDKKIKELQQTIEKAQKQIEELKNMNS